MRARADSKLRWIDYIELPSNREPHGSRYIKNQTLHQIVLAAGLAVFFVSIATTSWFVFATKMQTSNDNPNASELDFEERTDETNLVSPPASERVADNETLKESTVTESSTTVTVNGENIPADENGNVNETILSNDGQSTVHISVQNNSSQEGGDH